MKIKCFIKRTDSGWYATSVSTSLENLQRLVDGYIETVTFPDLDVVVVCNEDGRLRGLPYCCTIGDVELVGDVVVFGFDGDEFTDVPHSLKEWKQLIEGGVLLMARTVWTQEMLNRLHELRDRNWTVLEIAQEMGLPFEVVKSRISNEQNAAKKKQKAFKLDPVPAPEPKAADPAPDVINHPNHYTAGGIECINAIRSATTGLDGFEAYLSGTILKYIWRWKWKNGLEDLKKAERYLKWLISEVEQNG